jgi:hypothetical protein
MKLEDLSSKATYSYADYLTWAFEERIEIIKGKLFKMSPAPSTLIRLYINYQAEQ